MGFELKKLMQQFGVSTPGVVNYSGTAAPVAPTKPVEGAADTAMAQYQKDLAAYEANKGPQQAAHLADRAAYDRYSADYANRISSTPQYLDAQYRTTNTAPASAPTTVQDLYKTYLGREPEAAGAAGWTRQFADPQAYLTANPDVAADPYFGKNPLAHYDQFGRAEGRQLTPVIGQQQRQQFFRAARPEMQSSGLPMFGRNIYDTTGSYHGDLLGGPSYAGYTPIVPAVATVQAPAAQQPTSYGYAEAATGGSVQDLVQKYAEGGQVKTHYRTAGAVKLPSGYGSEEEEADFAQRFFQPTPGVEVTPVNMDSPPPPVITQLPERAAPTVNEMPETSAPLTKVALDTIKASSEPMAPAAAPVAPATPAKAPAAMPDRMAGIQSLLATYGPKDSAYGEDLKAARATAKAESDAFAAMLNKAMKSPEDEKASKAEIYFRLAAAFGAPTKTGQFSENLGMVGKELGEYSKGKRASAQQKLALSLEGQKMKMTTAKEDLKSLQALAGEEMKDKRAIATELIKDYIKSGEPQSAAGKQAVDEGLKPGTEAYQKRVAEIGNLNVEGKMAQISATLQNLSLSQANFLLNQDKFANQKAQQSKLTGPELKLKTEAEDLIASSKQSLEDLKKAYALNPNSLAGGWLEKGQQFLGEAAGSKDPTIVNTRILNNLLGSQGLAKLKATFGGAPTEGERAILMELEGIGSKTREERGAIIKRAYKVLQDRVAREQTRLDQITSGAYRTTTPLEGGTD